MSLNQLNFILGGVYVAETKKMGRGMFTKKPIAKGILIEVAPVVVMNDKDRKLLDQTLLHDYIFEWGEKKSQCCMALGCIAIYNHSYASNCEYEMNFKKNIIRIKSIRPIKAGEELFINYNGDWDDKSPVWFDAR